MANEQNLNPIKDSKVARALQEKSVKARKKNQADKKNLRMALEILLEKDFKDKDGNMISGAEAVTAKLFQQAMNGNVKAFETLRDTVGQKPVEKIMVAEVEQDVISDVEKTVLTDVDEG